mmetsp:Transcript_49982/g.127170  ORF Transcript_49982/g.127170 Transcript_49982/m.127170 type:complete len:183 (+) Transcript_49982:1234-1782(+)
MSLRPPLQRRGQSRKARRRFFLHCDSDAELTSGPDVKLERVNGSPFDASRMYKVATYQFLLGGMGDIQPMFNYVKEKGTCPPLENCLGIKHFIMRSCMRKAWCDILGGQADDSSPVMTNRAQHLFKQIDRNGNGFIEPEELAQFLESRGDGVAKHLVKFLIEALDTNSDGKLDLGEFCAMAS